MLAEHVFARTKHGMFGILYLDLRRFEVLIETKHRQCKSDTFPRPVPFAPGVNMDFPAGSSMSLKESQDSSRHSHRKH